MTVRTDVLGFVTPLTGAGALLYAPLEGETAILKDWCIYNISGSGQAAELFFDIEGVDFAIWRGNVPSLGVQRPTKEEFLVFKYPTALRAAGNSNHLAYASGAVLDGVRP